MYIFGCQIKLDVSHINVANFNRDSDYFLRVKKSLEYIFLDASSHLYKRLCPSGWSIRWSVGP